MKLGLDQHVALITGGGSGIGAEAARLMASEGARVSLAGVPAAGVRRVAEAINRHGGQALALPTDVAAPGAVRDAVRRTCDAFGRLDVAVANAGVQLHREDRDLHTMNDDAWDRTQSVNYRGVYLTCKAALAAMVEQGVGGSILITASISSLSGAPENPAYVASKHGVLGLMRHIAVHYARFGIRCNAICPGALETTPNHDEHPDPDGRAGRRLHRIPLGRLGTDADIAPWVAWLASPLAGYATGGTFVVDGGFHAG